MLVFEYEFPLTVVVFVFLPLLGRMAFVTFLAKDALVVVVKAMAGITGFFWLGFFNRLQVTLGAFDLGMLVLQGEFTLVVVVTAFLPAFWGVAFVAFLAKDTLVVVVELVAAIALVTQLLLSD